MARSTRHDDIIDLTEIIEKGQPSSPSSGTSDFDEQLADLLGGAGAFDAVSDPDEPEAKPRGKTIETEPETFVPDDLDALIGSLDDVSGSPAGAGKTEKVVEALDGLDDFLAEAGAKDIPDALPDPDDPGVPVPDDLDALIGDLDMPENGRGEPSIEEAPAEDVDALLDSLLPGAEAPLPSQGRPEEISEEEIDDLLSSIELESMDEPSASSPPTPTPKPTPASKPAPEPASKPVTRSAEEAAFFNSFGPLEDLQDTPDSAAGSEPDALSPVDAAELDALFNEESESSAKMPDDGPDLPDLEALPDDEPVVAVAEASAVGGDDDLDLSDIDALLEAEGLPDVDSLPSKEVPSPGAAAFAAEDAASSHERLERLEDEVHRLREQLEAVSAAPKADMDEARLLGLFAVGSPLAARLGEFVRSVVDGGQETVKAELEAAVSRAASAEAAVAALEARLVAVEQLGGNLEALQERVTALESRPMEPAVPEAFEARVVALESRTSEPAEAEALEARLVAVEQLGGNLEALQERVTALESRPMEPAVPEAFEARVAALESRTSEPAEAEALEARLVAVEQLGGNLEALQERVAALESRPMEPAVPEAFEARVAALESREQPADLVGGLKERLVNIEKQIPEALNALQGQMSALEKRLPEGGALEKRLALLEERQDDLSWEKQQGLADLQARTDALEKRIADSELAERVSALEADRNDTSLADRVAVLEARSTADLEARIVSLEGRNTEALEARLDAVESRSTAALEERLALLEARDMPDLKAVADEVLRRAAPELDKAAALSAAKVLREEIAGLVGGV